MPEVRGGQRQIPIVYEDDVCIVFDKPPGLLVIPADDKKTTTLTDIVNQQYAAPQSSSQPNDQQFR